MKDGDIVCGRLSYRWEERETVAVRCSHSHQPAVRTLAANLLQPAYLFSVQVFTSVDSTIISHCLSIMSLWYRCNVHSFQGINMEICFTICTVFHQQHTRCARKVMRLAMLCTNRQCCCLPLHTAVRLTLAVDSVQV